MLTHYPDAETRAEEEAFAAGREMTDRVLQGELLRDPAAGASLTPSPKGVWLDRATDRSGHHHALSGYLTDGELPIGSCFDTYV